MSAGTCLIASTSLQVFGCRVSPQLDTKAPADPENCGSSKAAAKRAKKKAKEAAPDENAGQVSAKPLGPYG